MQQCVLLPSLTHKETKMNINYRSLNIIREQGEEAEFQYVLDTHPAALGLYKQARAMVDNSIFKDKLTFCMFIVANKLWFSVGANHTHSGANFVRAYSKLWCELAYKVGSLRVNIS